MLTDGEGNLSSSDGYMPNRLRAFALNSDYTLTAEAGTPYNLLPFHCAAAALVDGNITGMITRTRLPRSISLLNLTTTWPLPTDT